jgi:ABC-2 type transport system ATP-binding protein
MSIILQTENLGKSFGKYSVLEDVSLKIESGTVFGLVGLNGAGKTTFLRLLLGLLQPDCGNISVLDMNPWKHQQHFCKKAGVVLENDGFWANLTPRENLSIYAEAKGLTQKDLQEYLNRYWSDTDLFQSNKKTKHLSRGQKMQCALCRAFLGESIVFFLDEPVLALDMEAYEHFCGLVKDARQRGAALIISSHQLDTIDKLCDRVGILRDKRLSELKRACSENEWIVVTDQNPQWKSLIEQCGGSDVTFNDGWRFFINNAETAIPSLIERLVSAGCSIREVKKLTSDNIFSSAIRDIYYNNNKGQV